MALTVDVDPPGGGVLITGTEDELAALSAAIAEAAAGIGGIVGHLLTDDGVEDFRVHLVGDE